MWLRDDLARSFPGARIYIYGYESEMQGSDSFQTLTDLGLTFQVVLEALLEPEDEVRHLLSFTEFSVDGRCRTGLRIRWCWLVIVSGASFLSR